MRFLTGVWGGTRMNLLVITQMYSQPDDMGDNKPTKTVNYFVKEWVAAGHKVVVMHCPSKFPFLYYVIPKRIKEKYANRISTMVPSARSRKKLNYMECGAKVYRYPMLKLYPGAGYSKFSMKRQMRRIIWELQKQEFRPDLVIGHFANPSAELVARVAWYYHAGSSIVFHQDCSKKNIQKYHLDCLVKKIGAIGARSELEAKVIKRDLNLSKLPFLCRSGVPNDAVETAVRLVEKHCNTDGFRFLYVGSFIKRKHLDKVIDAFSQFCKVANDRKSTLDIIGGGPEKEEIDRLVKMSWARGQITLLGRRERAEVLQYMRKSHIFTLISDGETYGMVYMEAMLQGCLVIASKGGGFDGMIQDGVNGFLCKPGDTEMLLEIYNRIALMTAKEKNQIGQNGVNMAMNYSEKEVAERYLNEVIKENTAGSPY